MCHCIVHCVLMSWGGVAMQLSVVDQAYSRSLLIVLSRVYLVVLRFVSEALDLLDCVTALSPGMHITLLNVSVLWHFE